MRLAREKIKSNFSCPLIIIQTRKYKENGCPRVHVDNRFYWLLTCRYDVPAISSRNLFDMSLAEYTFSTQSKVNIDVKYRRQFLVDYVYGFNSSSHVYFLTVQKKSYQLGKQICLYRTHRIILPTYVHNIVLPILAWCTVPLL